MFDEIKEEIEDGEEPEEEGVKRVMTMGGVPKDSPREDASGGAAAAFL